MSTKVDPNSFIGLSKKSAQNKAENLGLLFHLVRIGEENFFAYPADKREDRICIEIDNAQVSKAIVQ